MTTSRFRRPLVITAAVLAIISVAAVGTVMAMALSGVPAPAWITSTALFGLPLAFLLLVFVVLDSAAIRRRAGKGNGR